jgi:hypothetical protein
MMPMILGALRSSVKRAVCQMVCMVTPQKTRMIAQERLFFMPRNGAASRFGYNPRFFNNKR